MVALISERLSYDEKLHRSFVETCENVLSACNGSLYITDHTSGDSRIIEGQITHEYSIITVRWEMNRYFSYPQLSCQVVDADTHVVTESFSAYPDGVIGIFPPGLDTHLFVDSIKRWVTALIV